MNVRKSAILRLIMACLAISILAIALACASEEPTAAPTAVPPSATSPPVAGRRAAHGDTRGAGGHGHTVDGQVFAEPGLRPGVGPAHQGWDGTSSGLSGTARRSTPTIRVAATITAVTTAFPGAPCSESMRGRGDLTAIEGDLVESWEMSDDGLTLTMQLQQGVMFFDEMAEESIVPAEYDGGQILGDEFVCEDAVASYDRYVIPPRER